MIINQLMPTISYGDAVSNSAVNMGKVLSQLGIKTQIYAENIHPKMAMVAKSADKWPKDHPTIYHMSTGSHLAYKFGECSSKRMMLYHNITPPEFFTGYNGISEVLSLEALDQLKFLRDIAEISLADSFFNKVELDREGYNNTFVSPIIINYEDYDQKPDQKMMKLLDDDFVNIIFVGRIAPNKKQDDIVKSFFYYKKYINLKSRLILIGSYNGMENYYAELCNLVKSLDLSDVFVTNHIPFNQILAYYSMADLFLCMSEHEGFCVPLLEAMYFEVPILAYKSSAIPETLGNGGILTLDKDYHAIGEMMDYLICDKNLRNKIIQNQKERLEYFSKQNTSEIFKNHVQNIFQSVK